jgi:ribA/ribD-fused uncharacterized protein
MSDSQLPSKELANVWAVYDPYENDIVIAFVGDHAEELCHEHINCALDDNDLLESAGKWVVRGPLSTHRAADEPCPSYAQQLVDFVIDFEGIVPGDHLLRMAEAMGLPSSDEAWNVVRARLTGASQPPASTADCKECLQLLDERDRNEAYADQLAELIASITETAIGEHTSGNNPWDEAIGAAEEFIANRPAQPPETDQCQRAVSAPELLRGTGGGASPPSWPTQPPRVGPLKLDTDTQVFFYEQDHYYLSNFSAFRVKLLVDDGQGGEIHCTFDTSEAAYHWFKFPHLPELQAHIRAAQSAHAAFKLAEQYRERKRPDWDAIKADVMREVLRAKVRQHEYVRRKLLETGDRELIENSWRDDVWGWGPNRDGQNLLGKLWMEVRAELRASAPTKIPEQS